MRSLGATAVPRLECAFGSITRSEGDCGVMTMFLNDAVNRWIAGLGPGICEWGDLQNIHFVQWETENLRLRFENHHTHASDRRFRTSGGIITISSLNMF